MDSLDLTLKTYQKQLKDNMKLIYDNYSDILRTKTEHVNFEVQVKSAEIVRSYQALLQLVAEIRSFLIVNDLVPSESSKSAQAQAYDDKLIKLRDEMSMFLYELEIPLN